MRSVLVILLLLFSVVIAAPAATAGDTGPDIGKYAPTIELNELTGKTVALADFKGKVILLTFWSTLCAPCTAEMPSLNRLSVAFKDHDFQVLAVSIDSSDKPVRDFVAKNKITLTVLIDKEKEAFFDQYAGPSLPASYLIDRGGIIVEKYAGPQEWDSAGMKAKILKALKQK